MIGIVTGASSGIGMEFCRALDGEGLESIWIVARRADRLEALASELRTPCKIITVDLVSDEGLSELLDAIGTSDAEIGFLVNCAGAGRFGETWEVSDEDTEMMISLNITALTRISRACIPSMLPGSAIINVCSASAYVPLERLNVYASTKSYVRSFCSALGRELAPRGISVLEVSPGWVETDFISLSRTVSVPDAVFKHTVTKEEVVSRAMRDLARGKKRSVSGVYNRLTVFVGTHFPSIAMRIWSRSFR